MKTLLFATILSLFLTRGAFADHSVNVSGDSKVAVSGYDTVAFFTEKKAVKGDPAINAQYEGATYYFSSEENREAFTKNPVSYAPQFGGYCAYGLTASKLLPIDIQTWQVVDGKLYLNLNPKVQALFNKDLEKIIKKADKNWAKLANHG